MRCVPPFPQSSWLRVAAAILVGLLLASPADAQQEDAPAGRETDRVSQRGGETRLRFDRARIDLTQRARVRWTGRLREGDPLDQSYQLSQLRTRLDGWLGHRDVRFRVQLDWADIDQGGAVVKDAYVSWRAARRFEVQAGRIRVPFGRQILAGPGQFVARSITSNAFNDGRQYGVQGRGEAWRRRIEYRVGMFDQRARSFFPMPDGRDRRRDATSPIQFGRLQYNARVTVMPFGRMRYTESDRDSYTRPRVALGFNLERKDTRNPERTRGSARSAYAVDAAFKQDGWSASGEIFTRHVISRTGRARRSAGVHLQAGYYVLPERLELAVRLAGYDPVALEDDDVRREAGLGTTWHASRHVTVQADVRRLTFDTGRRPYTQIRSQLNIRF